MNNQMSKRIVNDNQKIIIFTKLLMKFMVSDAKHNRKSKFVAR